MFYLAKTPWILQKLYPHFVWKIPAKEKILYLTFDDGPHETATPFVLEELKKYNAFATFFCIGKNVVARPEIYRRIIEEGHRIGNHTFNHLNGWKTDDAVYIKDIGEAKKYIDSDLVRPPYGRLTKFQSKLLMRINSITTKNNEHSFNFKIIMWSVLSGDFDTNLSEKKCLENILLNAESGSVIVFHDSEKAFAKLKFVLPKVLAHLSEMGFSFQKIML